MSMEEKKSVHKFALEKKIVEMIDELERHSKAFDGRAEIIATAIRNLYEDQKALETNSSTHSETSESVYEYQTPESLERKNQVWIPKPQIEKMAERVLVTPDPETFRNEYSEQESPEVFLRAKNFEDWIKADKLKEICSDMSEVERLCDKFGMSDTEVKKRGEGGTGLIWNLHNRILPIKFVLHVIAYEITKTGKQFIDIEDLKDSVALELESFTNKLRNLEIRVTDETNMGQNLPDYKIDTAFPDNTESAERLPRMLKIFGKSGKKKVRFDKEVRGLVSNSRNRFLDTFVGKRANTETATEKPVDARFEGACFEMGLLAGNENDEITLTELGIEFVVMKNPVIDAVISDFSGIDEGVFDEPEVEFIVRNIFQKPKFDLECKIISDILGSPESLLVDEVAKMMSDGEKDYVIKIRKKNGEKFDDIDELMEKLKGPLGTRAIRQKAIATTGRLVELGLLVRGSKRQEKRPPKTIYSSTDLGKRIYEGILSKN